MQLDSYCRIPKSVLRMKTITPAAKCVYQALSGYAWGDEDQCWPSLNRLAEDTGLTRRGVQKALEVLEKANLITIEHRKKHDGMEWNDTNLYTLRLPEDEA